LTRDLLDTVRIDEASEQARAQLAAGFAAGTLTTSLARPAGTERARSGTGSRAASGS